MSILNQVSTTDKLIFSKHLAIMVKAGIPVAESLDLIAQQTSSAALKQVVQQVLANVQGGESLADSLAKHEHTFGELYVNLIRIGEESGTLEENLQFLSEQINKDLQLRKKIQGALLYPGLVITATGMMGIVISFFILPQLIDFFGAFDIELPLSTRILLFFANMISDHGLLVLLILFAPGVLLWAGLRISAIKLWWDEWKLKIPLVGNLLAYGQYARFSRNLGVLLQSGVSITRSLEVVTNTINNTKLQQDLEQVQQKLKKGEAVGDSLSAAGITFPPLISKMAAVGEKTGHLDETLLYLGDFYEEEIDNISKNLTTILEPFLLLVIGLVVGFMALAIISPIYGLTGSVR